MFTRKPLLPAIAIAVFALFISIWVLISAAGSGKTGYILIGKVMQDFEMKKDRERLLQDISLERKTYLDSLKLTIDNFYISGSPKSKAKLDSLKYLYELRESEFAESNQTLFDKYKTEVMDKITALSKTFAEDQGYEILLGADGSGVLMYADKNMDVTEEFTQYINQNYK